MLIDIQLSDPDMELLADKVAARLKPMFQKLTAPAPAKQENWLTTEQAMSKLGLKSEKGFLTYRKKVSITQKRIGKQNFFLESDLIPA